MYKRTRWHFAGLVLLIGLCLWGITAIGSYRKESGRSFWPLGIDLQGGTELTYVLDLSRIVRDRNRVAEEVKDVIAKRLNVFGLKEISIAVQGQDQLVIQLPGTDVQSVSDLKYTIEKAGNLNFFLVATDEHFGEQAMQQYEEEERRYLELERDWIAKKYADQTYNAERPQPPRYLVRTELEKRAGTDGKESFVPKRIGDKVVRQVLENPTQINREANTWDPTERVSGRFLSAVSSTIDDQTLKPAVAFELSGEGAAVFAEVTGRNVGRKLAIVLDDDVTQVATIKSRITGRGQLTGDYTDQDVKNIITVLRGGSLPTKPRLISESTVGAVLGQDSVASGLRAILVGIILVMAIMAVYYMAGGLVANTALALNLLLILSFVMIFNQTLTLPGIAGVLLTLAMAVDANILIFERYREERRKGKTVVQSLAAGYDRAFWVIFDSNLTTIITGYVLFYLGTGPVKGFAITLVSGLFASFFTSVYVTRVLLSALVNAGLLKELKMLEAFQTPRIPFVKYQRPFMLGSALLIAVTWVFVIWRGTENYGIDFTGGARVSMTLARPLAVDEMRSRIASLEKEEPDLFRDYSVQTLGAGSDGKARQFALLTRAGAQGHKQASAQEPAPAAPQPAPGAPAGAAPPVEAGQPAGAAPAPGASLPPAPAPAGGPTLQAPPGVSTGAAAEAEAVKEPAQLVRDALERMLQKENLLLPPPFPSVKWDAEAGGESLSLEVNLLKIPPELTEQSLQAKVQEYLETRPLFTTKNRDSTKPYRGITVTSVQVLERVVEGDPNKVARYRLKTGAYQAPLPSDHEPEAPRHAQVEDALRDYFRQKGPSDGLLISEPFPQVATVGPRVASSLQADALVAIFISIVGIVFYLALRFEFIYGLAGVIALIHDCMVAIGVMAVTDQFLSTTFPVKMNLNELAAILTIIGFSINDTIVLFDRIRENLSVLGKKKLNLRDVVDISINQTLARTLWTSVTVFLVDVILLGFGGDSVRGFAYIFAVGTIAGVYSSVFIAAPVAIWLHDRAAERRKQEAAQQA